MPNYQIQDNQSGKTVTVEGDHAPTQQDAEEIFQKAGLRGEQTQPKQQAPIVSGWAGKLFGVSDDEFQKQQHQLAPGQVKQYSGAPSGPNALGKFLFPQASEIARKDAFGESVSTRERLGAGLETGSYALPLGKVGLVPKALSKIPGVGPLASKVGSKVPGFVKTIAGRAEAGAEIGALQGFGKGDESTGQSAGTMAALNLALPGLSRLTQTLGFKGATGKTLGTLEKIEEKTGQKLTSTTREGMQSQMGSMQKTMENELKNLMSKGKTMTKKELYDHLDDFTNPQSDLYSKLGPSEQKTATSYIRTLKNNFDNVLTSFNGGKELLGTQIEGTTDNALGPFYNFMKSVAKDTDKKFWETFGKTDVNTKSKIAGETRSFLRKTLSGRSSDSKEFERIMKMKQTLGGMQKDITDEGLMKSVKQILGKVGLPGVGGAGVGGLGLLTANPALSVPVGITGAYMAIAERYPQVAPIIRNLLDNPKTAAVGDSLMKVLSGQINQESP